MAASDTQRPDSGSAVEVFVAFARLGMTAFGGPVAHLGYFRTAFVVRRRWLDEAAFAEIVALCSFLPGPTSSQTGVAIGLRRAGGWGGVAAWLGFTLPSAMLMTGVALAADALRGPVAAAVVHGLMLAAVAVVAQAVVGMARSLTPDWTRRGIALAAAAVAALGGAFGQLGAIVMGAVAGAALRARGLPATTLRQPSSPRGAVVALMAFVALLAGLPLFAAAAGTRAAGVVAATFRAGALVFGGGHVVLPLLDTAFVPRWLDDDAFLAGYGAAQALPGPLFAFAAYLGTAVGGVGLGIAALVAIFAPGMLLLVGIGPLWSAWQARASARAVVGGVNAAVVGLLAAALVAPVGTAAIRSWLDVALAAVGFAALLRHAPPWAVVIGLVDVSLLVG